VGISVGSATFDTDGETLDQLLIVADQAMYREKSKHKQGCIGTTAPVTQSPILSTHLESSVPMASLTTSQDDELASISVN
jgi:GGDEF domain-containing protein